MANRTMYALVTDQGTAAHETALCSKCFTTPNRNRVFEETKGIKDIQGGECAYDYQDCTENDALQCTECGWCVGPCSDYAPDTLAPDQADQDVCTTCFYRGEDHK